MKITDKIRFVKEVADYTVSKELGYMPFLLNLIYKYNLLRYFSDTVDDSEEVTLDEIDNQVSLHDDEIEKIKEEYDSDLSLYRACVDAVEYKKNQPQRYFDDLMIAAVNLLNKTSEQTIDKDFIDKLKGIMDKFNNIDTPEFAKELAKEII